MRHNDDQEPDATPEQKAAALKELDGAESRLEALVNTLPDVPEIE